MAGRLPIPLAADVQRAQAKAGQAQQSPGRVTGRTRGVGSSTSMAHSPACTGAQWHKGAGAHRGGRVGPPDGRQGQGPQGAAPEGGQAGQVALEAGARRQGVHQGGDVEGEDLPAGRGGQQAGLAHHGARQLGEAAELGAAGECARLRLLAPV